MWWSLALYVLAAVVFYGLLLWTARPDAPR